MNDLLEKAGQVEEMLAEAERLSRQETVAAGSHSAAWGQARAQFEQLKQQIAEGGSTGDVALDLKIMLFDSVSKDVVYHRLKWLHRAVTNRRNQLVLVYQGTLSGWQLGLLPDAPSITWHKNPGEIGFVKIPVVTSYEGSFYKTPQSEPGDAVLIRYHNVQDVEFDKQREERRRGPDSLEVVFGTAHIRRWAMTQAPSVGMQVAAAARLLERPLESWPELDRHIRDRREDTIVKLLNAMSDLKELRDLFDRIQGTPSEMLKSHTYKGHEIRTKVEFTETGAVLDFGLAPLIEVAQLELISLVRQAAIELQMEDNPTWNRAANMVDYEQSATS